jgi:hypothetical protein
VVGYETRVSCKLNLYRPGRPIAASGTLAWIENDGADVTCDATATVGQKAVLIVDGWNEDLDATIVGCKPNETGGYRLKLKLTAGSWPYGLFTKLASLNLNSVNTSGLQAPPCFKELGLTPPCTVEQVQQAFYRRARKVHPDRGGDVDSFVRLRQAYLQALQFLGGTR